MNIGWIIIEMGEKTNDIFHFFYPAQPVTGAVLRSKLVDERCRFRFAILLVDLTVQRFPWFSPKLEQMRVKIPLKDLDGGQVLQADS